MESTEEQELAQMVLDYLEQNPEMHEQTEWYADGSDFYSTDDYPNDCGTVMCVAGATVLFAEGMQGVRDCKYGEGNWILRGAQLLGIRPGDAQDFFYVQDNAVALDGLRALASGDHDKFLEILENVKDM